MEFKNLSDALGSLETLGLKSSLQEHEYTDIKEWESENFEAFVSGYKNNSGEWEEEFFKNFFIDWIKGKSEWDFYGENLALKKTQEIIEAIRKVENILRDGLDIKINNNLQFSEIRPEPAYPTLESVIPPPEEPVENDYGFMSILNAYIAAKISFIEVINLIDRKKRIERFQKAMDDYKIEYNMWKNEKERIEQENEKKKRNYQIELDKWLGEKKLFEIGLRAKNNPNVFTKQDLFESYCRTVLMSSRYPKTFPKEFEISFNRDNGVLVVDYQLPSFGQIPTLKEIKYIKSKGKYKIVFLSESAQNALYDSLLYQITLRTLHELYSIDEKGILKSIVFNGWVNSIDRGTGKNINLCILSVQANRDEFLPINLENVDPKTCFRNLKGIGSSKLHGMAPVAPIIKIDRHDKRFINPYEVADRVDESTNIAAMDWKDFENLIRELFEKEFKTVGGEVKITRASRDEGVDAIAFDPDPIRGGKIVIQAKRYTNPVGVAAVRDLYGTVVNEGATKGILVTTTDYGPDAYKFAKDKPLTLLNGNNLLHLLEKHGHKAKIDIKEAKKILAEQERSE